MLMLIFLNKNHIFQQPPTISNHWMIGGILFIITIIFIGGETMVNSLFILYLSFIFSQLSTLKESKKIRLFSNTLLISTLIHEILWCLFTGFSVNSILIFATIIPMTSEIQLKLDEDLISIFLGLFCGIRALSWTIIDGWKLSLSSDPLLQNWVIFLSSPILGVLLFYVVRYLIESSNPISNKNMNED